MRWIANSLWKGNDFPVPLFLLVSLLLGIILLPLQEGLAIGVLVGVVLLTGLTWVLHDS